MTLSIKQRMIKGETVFGTWCMLPSGSVVDVVARTGVDFIVIDLEHGSISLETAEEMVRAAKLHGCQPIIRVGDDQENTILRALETDCKAIMVPHVATMDVAQKVADSARYFPSGKRGLSPYTACHGYTHINLTESLKEHSDETLVGVLVEGQEGISNLSEIAQVDGIDLIYLGLYDISQSVGHSGELDHPEVKAQLNKCLEKIKEGGKIPGTFARDVSSCKNFQSMGFRFIAYVADSYILRTHLETSISSIKS